MAWYYAPTEVLLQFKLESIIWSGMHLVKYDIVVALLDAEYLKIYQGLNIKTPPPKKKQKHMHIG